jgi:hypothetical protein
MFEMRLYAERENVGRVGEGKACEVDILDTVERLQISDVMIIPFWI